MPRSAYTIHEGSVEVKTEEEGPAESRKGGTTAQSKRYYRSDPPSGTTAHVSGTTALPVRSRGPLALYPSPTYPFVA